MPIKAFAKIATPRLRCPAALGVAFFSHQYKQKLALDCLGCKTDFSMSSVAIGFVLRRTASAKPSFLNSIDSSAGFGTYFKITFDL
jgi:hypothetical protein